MLWKFDTLSKKKKGNETDMKPKFYDEKQQKKYQNKSVVALSNTILKTRSTDP